MFTTFCVPNIFFLFYISLKLIYMITTCGHEQQKQWQKANYLGSHVMMMANGATVYDLEYL